MNILFLIGNGFDINLGMETRYSDFYKYYSSIESSSTLIQKLKKEINNKIENWSDLELALGNYTGKLNSTEEFNEVFEDIEDKLADYLELIEKKFDFTKIDSKKIYKYFAHPESYLPTTDKNKVFEFKKNWRNSQEDICIITFNYTNSIEKIIDYRGKEININEYIKPYRNPIIIHSVEHIHGYYSERMVLGVNDISQMSNIEFQKNRDVIETLIKTECNQAQKHAIDDWCKSQIKDAHLICIFGSSIGDTDNHWWELIGEQLKRGCILILFEKGEPIPQRRPQKIKIAERKMKNYFLSKTKLNDKEKEIASDRIFIGTNTDMFNLVK